MLWCDPGDLTPTVGQRLVIATEDGERTARVAVGLTAAPPGMPVSPLRVFRPAEAAADSPEDIAAVRVDAVQQTRRHEAPPVSTGRVARLINRLLAVRQRHSGATPPLVDLGQAFPGDDSENPAAG